MRRPASIEWGARCIKRFEQSKVPTLVLAALCGVAVTVVNWFYLDYEDREVDISSWGSFFTCFGTIFAILSGLILVVVMNRFSALQQCIEDELNAVETIRDCAVYLRLTDKQTADLRAALYDYLTHVSVFEWKLMGEKELTIDTDTSKELLALHVYMADLREEIEATGHESRISLLDSLIIANVVKLAELRTKRLTLAMSSLPTRLKMLLGWMIMLLWIGFALLGVVNIYINIFMIISVSTALQWLIDIIFDLDHPFRGVWNVSKDMLDALRDKLAPAVGSDWQRHEQPVASTAVV